MFLLSFYWTQTTSFHWNSIQCLLCYKTWWLHRSCLHKIVLRRRCIQSSIKKKNLKTIKLDFIIKITTLESQRFCIQFFFYKPLHSIFSMWEFILVYTHNFCNTNFIYIYIYIVFVPLLINIIFFLKKYAIF